MMTGKPVERKWEKEWGKPVTGLEDIKECPPSSRRAAEKSPGLLHLHGHEARAGRRNGEAGDRTRGH